MVNEYDIFITPVGEKVYKALRDPAVKIILLPGGTRSGKTFSIMQNLHILMCEQPGLRITAWREKLTWARVSILSDWERKFLAGSGLSHLYHAVKQPPVWTLRQTGSTLEFSGLDDPQKVHGVAADIIWLNEAIEARKETVHQLLQRLEGKLVIDYNPSEEEHWVYDLARRRDAVEIHSTYKDNPFLPETTVREIEAYEDTPYNRLQGTVSDYHWRVYGLGLPARRQGLIFPGCEIVEEWPEEARHLGYGLDFGFYPDPAAFGRVGLFNGRLVLDELFYETGLNNVVIAGREEVPSIEARLQAHGISRREEILADSAGKSNIHELRTAGYNVRGVRKYPGSVLDGIELMQHYAPFYVTGRSVNTLRELKNYTRKKDRVTGEFLREPVDAYNHLMDLYRYVVQTRITTKKTSLKNRLSIR
ncbi:MAG: PBSX family phage terminase large subunit [Tannerellaceae bacterium]|nr:PBSX family phage terminase large subunit [Tannerellaceae bacterium]